MWEVSKNTKISCLQSLCHSPFTSHWGTLETQCFSGRENTFTVFKNTCQHTLKIYPVCTVGYTFNVMKILLVKGHFLSQKVHELSSRLTPSPLWELALQNCLSVKSIPNQAWIKFSEREANMMCSSYTH